MVEHEERPEAIERLDPGQVVHLDVRQDLREGREPFSRIMAACRDLPDGAALALRAIMEPVPLYRVMEARGYAHWTEQLGAEDWRVWFYPGDDDRAAPERQWEVDGGVRTLDVRGLEPPEPMTRTLAALETLPQGATLIQINERVPRFLLPLLEERGFVYELHEQAAQPVRVAIRRAGGA